MLQLYCHCLCSHCTLHDCLSWKYQPGPLCLVVTSTLPAADPFDCCVSIFYHTKPPSMLPLCANAAATTAVTSFCTIWLFPLGCNTCWHPMMPLDTWVLFLITGITNCLHCLPCHTHLLFFCFLLFWTNFNANADTMPAGWCPSGCTCFQTPPALAKCYQPHLIVFKILFEGVKQRCHCGEFLLLFFPWRTKTILPWLQMLWHDFKASAMYAITYAMEWHAEPWHYTNPSAIPEENAAAWHKILQRNAVAWYAMPCNTTARRKTWLHGAQHCQMLQNKEKHYNRMCNTVACQKEIATTMLWYHNIWLLIVKKIIKQLNMIYGISPCVYTCFCSCWDFPKLLHGWQQQFFFHGADATIANFDWSRLIGFSRRFPLSGGISNLELFSMTIPVYSCFIQKIWYV